MHTRREFIQKSSLFTTASILLPSCAFARALETHQYGVQLYSFRNEMAKDALGTLEKIAAIGLKKIESARSGQGHY